MQIVVIANRSGGVSKTTTAHNLSAALAIAGKKTLAVDLDPQCDLTRFSGVVPEEQEQNAITVVLDKEPLGPAVVEIGKNLSLLPCHPDFVSADTELQTKTGGELYVKKALKAATDYDFVILDSPPSLGKVTVAAMVAAHHVLIPMPTQYKPLEGAVRTLNTVELVKEDLNPDLNVLGIVATMFVRGRSLDKEVLRHVETAEGFEGLLFDTVIRQNTDLAQAPSYGKSIFEHAPRSNGAQDYVALTKEIVRRMKNGR
ncbi:ParA family protein [Desulfovibrio ferrophilus]|uniref:Cobyrinic acid ac-diamide synthase n=1 Tax=Desulfovibrio ferrophilus TaxID=241368 RepID=A0A2Z6B3Z9_9BACT|nr:ParA family protein [Desulfovibrio ferrophilus]BBD10138.1 cobyrinic acid ac-diamide synthase [Desulfovibrio ferrophilus]